MVEFSLSGLKKLFIFMDNLYICRQKFPQKVDSHLGDNSGNGYTISQVRSVL